MTQADLAERMTQAGRPMNKAALLRIERGERGLSLDEALALIYELHAVPAHLLTPPGDERVWLTDKYGVDGGGMRGWLRYGDSFIAQGGDLPPEQVNDLAEQAIVGRAQALMDAISGDDRAGRAEALRSLSDAVVHYRQQQEKGLENA